MSKSIVAEFNVPDITTTLIDPFDRARNFMYPSKSAVQKVETRYGLNERAQVIKTFREDKLLEGQVRAIKDFYFKVYAGHIKKLRERLIKEKKLSEKERKEVLTKKRFEWNEDTDPLRRDLAIREFMRRVKNYSLEAPYRPPKEADIEEFVAFDENTYISERLTEGGLMLEELKKQGLKPKGKRFITKEEFNKEINPEFSIIMGPKLATYFPKAIINPDKQVFIPGKRLWRMKTSRDYEYEERDLPDQIKEMTKERRKQELIKWGKKQGIIPEFEDLRPPPEEEQKNRAGGKTRVMTDYEEKVKGYMTKILDRINEYIDEVNERIKKKEKSPEATKFGVIGGFAVGIKVDTSKVGAGIGKEVSITEGKKFREMFKGGAKTAWLSHVDKFRKENPELSYKEALKEAKKTYTPMRKKEREQQKVDTAEKKVEKGPKPRKLTKKQVALRFNSYSESRYSDFNGYKPDFEKVWNEHIKGKRFKDNEELLKAFKEKFEGVEVERKKAYLLTEKGKEEEREKKNTEIRRKTFKEKYEGKIPSKFKFVDSQVMFSDEVYERILKYHEKKSGEKGHTEYLKAQRDYELIANTQGASVDKDLRKKWKKLINEEKRKRKAMKSK